VKRALALAVVIVLAAAGVALASDDPDFASFQYGPQQIYAPEAWTVSRGAGVTIAVIDSGVQLDHPDLRDKMLPGYDFYDDDDDPSDENGHGTHVAGIAAATTDNGIGMAGVAPDAKILPIRVLGADGSATGLTRTLTMYQDSIDFAIRQGAQVINLSLGEEGDSITPEGFDRLSTACRDAFLRGSLCIAAAGNAGNGKPSGYGNDFQGLVVAATDRQKRVADFSQRADTQWSVAAPGVAIHSTWVASGYSMQQGTSMAAPHVAGVAALLFAQGLTNQQVVDRLLQTATPLNDGGGTTGAGLVNAAAAVGAEFTPASTPPPVAVTTTTVAAAQPSSGATSTTIVRPEAGDAPVELTEGTIEGNDDLLGAGGAQFETALADAETLEEIELSDGFSTPFLIAVALFLVITGILGFLGRRLVVRRGIGAMKT
jgi:subtilisin family serine protease